VDLVYPVAKTLFWPWLRFGLRWTVEGEERIPTSGPVLLASNHASYLDPLTLAYVTNLRRRRVRYLAKMELFEKRGLGTLLRAAHQIPVQRGTTDSASALTAAIDALHRGECVAVFPEGTISTDLEPMRAKSGTARLAQAANLPVVPVGLWGSHRILTKGRKPKFLWRIPQVGVVGDAIEIEPGEHVKAASDRIMDGVADCVARARALYPEHPSAGTDDWWWRAPETAHVHQRREGGAA
jgi:1-acyl-sn-glycerol-3-phosphate acyltransferase